MQTLLKKTKQNFTTEWTPHKVVLYARRWFSCEDEWKCKNPNRQINPTWNVSGFFRLDVTFVEISFVAVLDPLSVSRFEVRYNSYLEGGNMHSMYRVM